MGDLHIGQYDALFANNIIDNVVARTEPMEFKGFRLAFEGIEIHKPYCIAATALAGHALDKRLLPRDCREQALTYGGSCFLKIKFEYKGQPLFYDYKPAGTFPVMLKSRLCHLTTAEDLTALSEDPAESGGIFVVGGYDKLIRFHIAYRRNHVFVLKGRSKDSAYTEYSCMIRSVGPDEIGQKNELKYCTDGNIHMKVFVNKRTYFIPVILLLRALANTSDEEIYRSLGSDQRILQLLAKMKDIDAYSKKEALAYLGRRFRVILRIEDLEECGRIFLRRVVLVHLEKAEDKYNLLIDAIKKLLRCVDGEVCPDNIDLPSSHELYTEAQLIPLCIKEKLEEIKRSMYMKILSVVRTRVATGDSTTSLNASEAAELLNELDDEQAAKIAKCFHALDFSIGNKLQSFLSTGNLTTFSCSDLLQTTGFTILAERINYWRFASHFQSVSRGAFFTTLKITTFRKLRPEGWGFLCPVHTPDGAPCGLLLHLAKSCRVNKSPSLFDSSVLYDYGLVPIARGHNKNVPLYWNGRLCGTTDSPHGLAQRLREHRSLNDLCMEICHESGPGVFEAIYVSDGLGAMMRRVANVRTGRSDWVGIKEQVFLNIRLHKYASIDSFNDYDKVYAGEAHSTGITDKLKNDRSDTNSDLITERLGALAERTFGDFDFCEIENGNIFSTVAACIPFSDHNPSPRNIFQCQMAKQAMGIPAYNMKTRTDNKMYWVNYLQTPMVRTSAASTFDRYPIGFNCMVAVLSYTAYDMEDAVVINKSAIERGLFNASIYKTEKFALEKNSFVEYTPSKETPIRTGDALVRYSNEDTGPGVHKYAGAESGVVECVRIFNNGTPCVTVTIRIPRRPQIGDKFCSRHGQKGVLSMQWPEINMPFTESGVRPDIIINPHAFPSRMTIGMLLESMCGKAALVTGCEQDATAFTKRTIFDEGGSGSGARNIGDELRRCGFNYYGNEPMYSGITGTEFRTDIFIGAVYYQRLRHMVNDKYQVRTSGAVVATTHQPVGGRKNKGGIRFGEMEKDALIVHGAAYTLKDRLMDCSDRTLFIHCGDCGSILFSSKTGCACGGSRLKTVELPYVFKYLCCELLSMNVRVKIEI